MAIYIPPKDLEKNEKLPEYAKVVQAVPSKKYTEGEVQAILEHIRKGGE